jgi:hypothetical protein
LESFAELVEQGQGYTDALEAVKQGIQDPSPKIKNQSVALAIELVRQDQDDPIFAKIAKLATSDPDTKELGDELFKKLLSKRHFYDKAFREMR